MAQLAIEPPAHDPLGVLSSTAPVVRAMRLVTLDEARLRALAGQWVGTPWPTQTELAALHFHDGSERTANWMLLVDALNFCFWGEPGAPRWRVNWQGRTHDGYYALATALTRAVAEGRPVWQADYLAALDEAELGAILRPAAGSPPIPLFAERLRNAREVGRVLLERYDGQFARAIEACDHSAVALALLLAHEFPSFDDVVQWRGQTVRFYKRAQICVADLAVAFDGVGWGAFDDRDRLTAFADYKLPQLLRRHGALVYAPELAHLVDGYTLIPAGTELEIAIRAATIWAVELLRRALADHGIVRDASAIDYRLWLESQHLGADARPYHRTRTIFY